jgi:predicted lipoprotein with Yx(FWY)xxD motif
MKFIEIGRRFMLFAAGLVLLVATGACSSGSDGASGTFPVAGGTTITGTVTAPGGTVAKATTSPLQWFASLFVSESYAQAINSFLAVANVQVILFNIDNQGNPVPSGIAGLPDPIIIAQTTTTVTGTYSLNLPQGFTPTVTTVVQASTTGIPVAILSGTNVVQAAVIGTTVNINPITQVSLVALVNYLVANQGTTFAGSFTAVEVSQFVAAIQVQVLANISLVGSTVSVTVTNILTGLQTFINTAVGGVAGLGQDPPTILTTTLPTGTVGQPYGAQLLAIGGTGTYAWSTIPTTALQPFGLTLNSTTGIISGTPTNSVAGIPITVQVAAGSATAQQVLSLTIIGGGGGGLPSNIPISIRPGGQMANPQIISDGAGGAIIVWEDPRSDTRSDIYAQGVNSAGVAQWAINGVPICTEVEDQTVSRLISDGAGGAIITWEDQRGILFFDFGAIYAQRVNSAGVTQWAANGVPIATSNEQEKNPRLASDGAGGAIIVWERGAVEPDIYAQRVNGAGVVQWTVDGVPVNSLSLGLARLEFPQIVTDGAGGAIIAWQHSFPVAGTQIYAQRVSSTGVGQWTTSGVLLTNYPVNLGGGWTGQGRFPQLIGDGAGGAIIAWGGNDDVGHGGLFAQRINSSGVPQWIPNGVFLGMGAADQITSDGGSGAIITWADLRNGANSDIYAQRVNSAGGVQWTTDGVPISTGIGNQDTPQLTADGAGGAIIVWQDRRSISSYDVYAQRVNTAGVAQWTANGVAISTAVGSQDAPQLTAAGAGGAIMVWQDGRTGTGNGEIYAQIVNGAGVLQ